VKDSFAAGEISESSLTVTFKQVSPDFGLAVESKHDLDLISGRSD
jgi:hypothetical protein